jgi:hypothetical protein
LTRIVFRDGSRAVRCPDTGLTIPECSCRHCIEGLVERFHPHLLDREPPPIALRRKAGRDDEGPERLAA